MSYDNLFSSERSYLDASFEVHAIDDHESSSSRYFSGQNNDAESSQVNSELCSFVFRLMKRESDKKKLLKGKKGSLKKSSSQEEDLFSKFL